MNPHRAKEVRRTILECLKFAGGFALPDSALRANVSGLVRPGIADAEWTTETAWLEQNEYSVRIADDFDPGAIQWAITERGRVLLASQ